MKKAHATVAPLATLDLEQLAAVSAGHKYGTRRATAPRKRRGSGPGGHSN